MKKTLILLFLLLSFSKTEGQVRIITTICGNDTGGYSGDGGPATNAKLQFPEHVCFDIHGDLLIADDANHRIRKIDLSTGIITTIAGTGVGGYSGDGNAATTAKLFVPAAVCSDTTGNIYISDALNARVRKIIATTGDIITIAGNGIVGNIGDGGPATNARLNLPTGLCLDKEGNIYISDAYNFNIRKIDISTGLITTIAGNGTSGYSGDGGLAINAALNTPGKVFIDTAGNIVFSDVYNSVIRKITVQTGIITTIAGTGTQGYAGDNGPAINASLDLPYGLFINKRNDIYIAEWGSGVIRMIDGATGIIRTMAGTGMQGYCCDDGPATNAQLIPDGICVDDYGTMYIADVDNQRIRKVYDPTLGILKTTEKHCKLYPNPAHHLVTIEHAKGHTLRIYDVTGRKVAEQQVSSDKETIVIAQLNSGVYVVQVTDGDGMQELIQLLVN